MTNSGFILVDKPAGITSHDVVDQLRRVTGIKKIGHAGTLDPFATGLLILAVGRQATKEIARFSKLDKVYEAEFVLGATTETLDPESDVIVGSVIELARSDIESAMKSFTGDIKQIPPMHSAIKVKGKKLYELARKGETIELAPRPVTIFAFELLEGPKQADGLTHLSVRIHCSSGTYIRALARDLGAVLGTTGYVNKLVRTKIGPFELKIAEKLPNITPENWLTLLQSQEMMQIDGA